MVSYVNKKFRVFSQADGEELKRRRSDGRMKTYQSETDARAWCGIKEDRRQHILELIRQGDGKNYSLGKFIPIDAIIDILLADKNAGLKRLQEELVECRNKEGVGAGKSVTKRAAGAPKGPTDREGVGTKSGEKLAPSATPSVGFRRQLDGQLETLQNALAEKDVDNQNLRNIAESAIEQLENIKDIVDDKDPGPDRDATNLSIYIPASSIMPEELDYSKFSNPITSWSTRTSSEFEADSCKAEIDALENEIANMKVSSQPEAEIVKKEVEVLKKYCAQLSAIQEENQELKIERDLLRGSENPNESLKEKLRKLEEVTEERNKMRIRLQQLEKELTNYDDLPQEVDKFRKKSQMLESLEVNRDDLVRRLDKMVGLEEEVRELKRIADQCAELEGEKIGKNREIDNLTCKCKKAESEKEAMREKIKQMEKEMENLKNRSREWETLKVERDCFKCCLDDMGDLQQDYEKLLKKTQDYDDLQAECALYKTKYEELQNLEDECNELRTRVEDAENLENERDLLLKEINDHESCIKGQESEIKRLALHIDSLSQNLEKRQPVACRGSRLENSRFDSLNRRELHKKSKPKVELLQAAELLKRELELERQKNNDLTNQFASHLRTIASITSEISTVRKENTNDKRILSHLNTTLVTLEQNLDKETNMVKSLNHTLRESGRATKEEFLDHCTCSKHWTNKQLKGSRIIPHFHAEVVMREAEKKKYKDICVASGWGLITLLLSLVINTCDKYVNCQC